MHDEKLNDTLWDVNDTAKFLKTSNSWVYHASQQGRLPCIRIGALLRFDPAVIRAFVRGEKPSGGRVIALPTK